MCRSLSWLFWMSFNYISCFTKLVSDIKRALWLHWPTFAIFRHIFFCEKSFEKRAVSTFDEDMLRTKIQMCRNFFKGNLRCEEQKSLLIYNFKFWSWILWKKIDKKLLYLKNRKILIFRELNLFLNWKAQTPHGLIIFQLKIIF